MLVERVHMIMRHINKRGERMGATDSLPFLYIAMAGGLKNGQLKDVEKLVSTTVATRKCTGK
jgi:hypothetical protein